MTERVAVIPARSGSKRIPGKNTRLFAGRPILEYPLEAAHDSNLFQRIIVTTDNNHAKEIAMRYQAEVLERPPQLADDFSGTTEVLQNLLSNQLDLSKDAWVYMIYPTSPLTSELISSFVARTELTENSLTASVFESSAPIQRALRLDESGRLVFREPDFALMRTQDLENLFFDAGKMYGARKEWWMSLNGSVLENAQPFIVPNWLAMDIDTLDDWHVAEYIYKRELGL